MNPTTRFTDRAGSYALGRPTYPTEAIDALLADLGDPSALVAVDLGSGTGISSRLLADRGVAVLAVEPNAAMRLAAEPHPRVTAVDATAESTGVEDEAVDLVTAFQAFHWFDADAVVMEMQRILVAGGRAAIVYNERDESDAATAAYGEIVRTFATSDVEDQRARAPHAFLGADAWASTRTVAFPNVHAMDRATLHARAASTSYLPHDGPSAAKLSEALDAAFLHYAVDGTFSMVMQTIVTIGETSTDEA